jgi:hypothetical protein
MGYVDNNGEHHYQPGHGKGVEGSAYDAERPQGHFGGQRSAQYSPRFSGGLPGWVKDRDSRDNTLLVFFERRANKSLKIPPGDFRSRLEAATGKLEAARQEEMRLIRERLEAFGNNRRDFDRLKFLEQTGEFTTWASAVLKEYFFDAADCPEGMTQSYDAGQCAARNGDVQKIFVKQLVKKVDDIGLELYPDGRQRCAICGEPFLPPTRTFSPARPNDKYCERRHARKRKG